MDDRNRPNAALINREWYECAKGILSPDGLGRVLVAAVDYVLSGGVNIKLSEPERIVFTMCRPALDSDVKKYQERCVRNAQNAKSRFERVGASGSESQRVGAITTPTPTPTPNTTTTTNDSISAEEKEGEEKFIVYGYFWSVGSQSVVQECTAFWNYYEALGWKNNKGAAIINKLSAARMWKRQYETREPKAGAREWFDVMRRAGICDYNIWNTYGGAERAEDCVCVHMRTPEEWRADCVAKCGHLLAQLAKLWKVPEVRLVP